MANPGGHLLVSQTLRLIRFGVDKATRVVRNKWTKVAQVDARTEPLYARTSTQPANRVAAIRQGHARSCRVHRTGSAGGNSTRHFSTHSQPTSQPLRSSYPQSRTRAAVSQVTARTPFASTLRPNLTGGTLSRTSGGYNTGAGRINGVRYFSHTPAAPAEVVQNVSQAIRAFWLSGQKARFDGTHPRTGEKRFRAVSELQEKTMHKLDFARAQTAGSYIDFKVSPTITAIGPLSTVPRSEPNASFNCEDVCTIANPATISDLAIDFSRALKDLAAVMNDLKHLAVLGELPLELVGSTVLRVRFPGCDIDTVESLCKELHIRRGIVGQDEDFDAQNGTEVALLFPCAPSKPPSESMQACDARPVKRSQREGLDWQDMMISSPTRDPGHVYSTGRSHDFEQVEGLVSYLTEDGEIVENPWLSSPPSDYSSLHASDEGGHDLAMFFAPQNVRYAVSTTRGAFMTEPTTSYEGLEGIYKFIEQCDRARK